jgi:radical SAM superfamily enzyme YgiQ (UPF0313 family)
MKISLVFPPFYLESLYNLPPLGLVNLGTALKASGHEVVIHDLVLDLRRRRLPVDESIYDVCARRILKDAPQLVGISAQCASYPPTLRLAETLKKRKPEVPVLIGGHNASFVDKQTLERHPQIDMVLRGEGEVSLPDLVKTLESGGELAAVEGLTWRTPGGAVQANPDRELIADLNQLPDPDHSLVPELSEYKKACGLDRSIAIVEIGRGCPHRCAYCSESALWRRKIRTFNPARLVREMARLADAGAESFLMSYDQFTARRDFVEEFCQLVLDQGLERIPWHGISRLDTVDKSLLDLMRQAGCASLCYGADSGSKKTLTYIRKRIDQNVLFTRVRETTACGVTPTLSFIIGFPEEEPQDVDATLELALRCAVTGDINPLIQLPTVLPGADLHRWTKGRLTRQVDTYFALGLEYDGRARLPSDEALINSDPELFSSFYNPPCPGFDLLDLDRIAQTLPIILSYCPKTMLLLSNALNRGVSGLILEFLAEPDIPGDSFADKFSRWALAAFRSGPAKGFAHLPEVLAYENAALEAQAAEEANALSLNGAPVRRGGLVLREFSVDMDRVVQDLRAGLISPFTPPSPCFLAFFGTDSGLEVSEINPFGRDLLDLCDGENSPTSIAKTLFGSYGDNMDPKAFDSACREALDQLAGLGFIRFGRESGEVSSP